MFYVYAGLRRTGKSYSATLLAKQTLEKYQNVWLNYFVDFRKYFPKLPHEKCKRFDDLDDIKYMRNGLLILDEAHWKLSSRGWMSLKPQTHEYLAQSGKLHMDIILISQNFDRLDTIARDLTERIREFHCLGGGYNKLPLIGWYKDYRPWEIGKKKRKSLNWFGIPKYFRYSKKIAASYDSDELFGSLLKALPPKEFKPSYFSVDTPVEKISNGIKITYV